MTRRGEVFGAATPGDRAPASRRGLQALGKVDEGFVTSVPPLLTRRAQGRWDGTRIVGPLKDASAG